MSVDILALALIFGFIPFLIFVFVLVMALFGAGRSRKASALQKQEAEIMQDICTGLTRLEKRVESLEVLLNAPETVSRDSRMGER